MFTDANYMNGWLIYGAGALVGFLCWWYMLSKLPLRPLRPILLGAMAGLLFMPWYVSPDSAFMAPAWLVAGSEGFFDGAENFWRAGTPMLMAIVIGAVLGLIIQLIRLVTQPKAKPKPAKKTVERRGATATPA